MGLAETKKEREKNKTKQNKGRTKRRGKTTHRNAKVIEDKPIPAPPSKTAEKFKAVEELWSGSREGKGFVKLSIHTRTIWRSLDRFRRYNGKMHETLTHGRRSCTLTTTQGGRSS